MCIVFVGDYFLDTLASYTFPFVSSYLFAFRLPVIYYKNPCLAIILLGSQVGDFSHTGSRTVQILCLCENKN